MAISHLSKSSTTIGLARHRLLLSMLMVDLKVDGIVSLKDGMLMLWMFLSWSLPVVCCIQFMRSFDKEWIEGVVKGSNVSSSSINNNPQLMQLLLKMHLNSISVLR